MDMEIGLGVIKVRGMNRFLSWYWQWTLIENINGEGNLKDIEKILLDKPIIEFAGIPLDLRGNRTYYKLNIHQQSTMHLTAFVNNSVN